MKAIRSRGKLNIISNIPLGIGSRKSKDFLGNMVEGFIKYSANYMEIVNESPFAYSERQLNSLLGPAMADFTDAFLLEMPTSRKCKILKSEMNGWVDCWARYRKIDFYFELKHSYGSYKSGIITQRTFQLWSDAINQTKNCAHSLLRMDDSDGIMVLPIHVIPIYESVHKEKEALSIGNLNRLLELQEIYHQNLKPSFNWSALWIINEDLVGRSYHEYGDNLTYYSAVLIVSNVTEKQ